MDIPSPGDKRFRAEEATRLLEALARAESPLCPRCGGAMERTDLPPRPDVPYVRRRILLLCGSCRASTVLDHREVERRGGRGGT